MLLSETNETAPPRSGTAPRAAMRLLAAAVLIAMLLGPALWFAFPSPWWRHPDPDLILAYNGLVIAEGSPQEFFDHTGYLYLLLLGGWYDLLHAVGLLGPHTVVGLPPVADQGAYEAAWIGIIQAGRAQMAAVAVAFVLAFAVLVGCWLDDRRLGLLAGALLAGAAGVVSMLLFMRTELLSSVLVTLTLLLAVLSPRQPSVGAGLALLAAAGCCAVLAIEAKVFAVVPLAAVPLLVLILADPPAARAPSAADKLSPATFWITVGLGALAVVAAVAMLADALSRPGNTAFKYTPVAFGLFGLYQAIIAAGVVAAMAAYAVTRKIPVRVSAAAVVALAGGMAVGLLAMTIRYDPRNVTAVVNPVEHLFVFAMWSHEAFRTQANVLDAPLLTKLLKAVVEVLKQRISLHPMNTTVLEWLVIVGMISGRRDRERRWMVQAAALVAIAWGIQIVFHLRHSIFWYFVYTDPLVVMAASIVAARWRKVLLDSTRIRMLVVIGVVIYAGFGWERVLSWESRFEGPETQCYWTANYLTRLETLPFCRR